MLPSGPWQRELLEFHATRSAQALSVLVPLALALPALSLGLPAFHQAAILSTLVAFFCAVRAGRRLVQWRDSGILGRLAATPAGPLRLFLEFALIRAATDFILLLPTLGLVLVRCHATAPAAALLLALAFMAVLLAQWLGFAAGSLASSQGEVVPHCLVLSLLALFAAGVFSATPLPQAWREVLASAFPISYFHRALRGILGLGSVWPAAAMLRGAAASSLAWLAAALISVNRYVEGSR